MKDLETLDQAIESYERLEKSAETKPTKEHYRQRGLWLKELKKLRERK